MFEDEDKSGDPDECVSHGQTHDRDVLGASESAIYDGRREGEEIAELDEETVAEDDHEDQSTHRLVTPE